MKTLKVRLLKKGAKAPQRMTSGSGGYDLFACENVVIFVGKSAVVKLGFALEFEKGYLARVADRSSLSVKHGIQTKAFVIETKGSVFMISGVIDSDYRGEWMVVLLNLGEKPYTVKKGDRVGQVFFPKIALPKVKIVKKLTETKRGGGGIGSTGK